jgi:RNA-directed DNA polymerase
MRFDFDDSPQGAEVVEAADVSAADSSSAHKSKRRRWQVERPAPGDRATGLLERSASIDMLEEALRKVASNKGAPGPDRQSVADVLAHKATILPQLSEALLNGSYQPGDIRRCWIPKSSGGRRGLGIPNVVDRIVQEAVRHELEPIFEPIFHPSSHGFRPERSCHTAIAEASEHIRDGGLCYVVDIDLKSFFDRVSHQRLLDRLQKWIADMKLVRLIGRMLRAKVVFPDGHRTPVTEGVPQGGPLSPLLSNVVLDELDWELERRGHRFVRYADDCNIYVGSLRSGNRVKDSISRFISRRLRLEVNEEKSAVAPTGERHFLGFRVSVSPAGELKIELSKRSRDRIYQRLRELLPRNAGRSQVWVIARLNSYLRGWLGFFGPCTKDTLRVLRGIDAHARRRLRAIFVRNYRRPRDLLRALVRRRAPRRASAKVSASRRGPWHKSHRLAVERALSNAHLAALGLVSLADLWHQHPARPKSGPAHAG